MMLELCVKSALIVIEWAEAEFPDEFNNDLRNIPELRDAVHTVKMMDESLKNNKDKQRDSDE